MDRVAGAVVLVLAMALLSACSRESPPAEHKTVSAPQQIAGASSKPAFRNLGKRGDSVL